MTTVLDTHEIAGIEAANGRFFYDAEPLGNMYTLSQTIFVDNKKFMHDDRGVLVQFPIYHIVHTNNPDNGQQTLAIHSLALDGSRHAQSELAWRYTVAVPYKGRTVQDLYVTPHSLQANTLIYDQQGALKQEDTESDASALAHDIQAIVGNQIFRETTREVAAMRAEAEDSFEQFMANLIARGVDLRKMKALIDKREATVKRRGFVACSAIVR